MPSLLLKLLTFNKQTGNIFMFLLGFYLSYTPTYPSEASTPSLTQSEGLWIRFALLGKVVFLQTPYFIYVI